MVRSLNRAFSTNLIIGASIALFVWFLKESALLEFILATTARCSAWLCLFLARNRFEYAPSAPSVASDLVSIVAGALIWTYVRSVRRRLLSVASLALMLIPVSVVVYRREHIILTSVLVVAGIAAAIALEAFSDLLSRQIHTRLLDEKKEGEFAILGHLSHNVRPNLQIARSPIAAVRDFLAERGIGAEALALRLDGSLETVGEALEKALLSLDQIGAILENTKQLVTQQIRAEEFGPAALVPLLLREVAPLYAGRLRVRVLGREQLTARVHRASFVEAINNLVRNAEMHGFAGLDREPELVFEVRETRRTVRIDYTNNGKPFPANLSAKDFLSYGKKSSDSPGDGLGGAWIGKMVEAHHGSFEIIRDHHPLHFRIILPKGGSC
ncbi:sensor histidine kinase [Geomesophilobacter sediminis]|uniref:Sensor histidine kinase n=1 Tax=Geomesophilobacter sediminis TaxID=2798584 RepID=A0A8J7JKY4_9BACT|nr:sensor histidine kinase [Geomesophilobacter sediminis]MBJ6724310.1 sensor histidine kinase [Geomesophilobacter sediminis]